MTTSGRWRADLNLNGEHIGDFAVVTFGPQMHAGRCVDELDVDADALTRSPDTSLEHVTDTELASDPAYVCCLAAVLEARIARDDEQLAGTRQLGNHIVGDPIGKILLLDLATQVVNGSTASDALLAKPELGPPASFGCATAGASVPDPSCTSPTNRKPLRGRVLMSR